LLATFTIHGGAGNDHTLKWPCGIEPSNQRSRGRVVQYVMADLCVNVAVVNAVKRTRTFCERRNRQYKRYFNTDLAHLPSCTSTSAFRLTSNTTSTFDRITKLYSTTLPYRLSSARASTLSHPRRNATVLTLRYHRFHPKSRYHVLTTVFLVHPDWPRYLGHEGYGEEDERSGRSSPTSRFARLLADSSIRRLSKRATEH